MKTSGLVIIIASLTALLAAIAASVGFFMKTPGETYEYTTLRGHPVKIYGQGLYHYDTLFFGAGYKGQDAVALFVGVPLLIISVLLYQRGFLMGHLLLIGLLGYFLYLYSSMALGAAYNPLFLIYIAVFSLSLFGFILTFNSAVIRLAALDMSQSLPGRKLAIFMFVAGAVTLFVWGMPLITALIKGAVPERMDSYTTMVTYALDLAVITPGTLICGILILQNKPIGLVIAVPLLTLIVLLAPQIILSTYFQRAAGVPFTTGEFIGPVAGFVILGAIALWFLINLLRNLQHIS